MSVDVDAIVTNRVSSIQTMVSEAQTQAELMFAAVQDVDNTIPPYLIPGSLDYTPEPIAIDASKPDKPDVQGLVDALQPGNLDEFEPGDISVPDTPVPQDIINRLPGDRVAYEEAEYTSQLKDELVAKLRGMVVNGGTGLSADVEQAIQDRQSERDEQEHDDAIDKLKSAWSASGFELPDNVLAAQIAEVNKKRLDLRTDRSREILVDSYKMADTNTRWAVEQGIVLESRLMEHFNNVCNRALEAVFRGATTAVEVFKGLLAAYIAASDKKLKEMQVLSEQEKVRLEAYKGKLLKYQTDAEVASTKLEALMKKYGVEMTGYTADISKATASANVQVEQQRIVAQNYLQAFMAAIQSHQVDMNTWVEMMRIKAATTTGTANMLAGYIAQITNSLTAIIHASVEATQTLTSP